MKTHNKTAPKQIALKISVITLDKEIQPRSHLNKAVVTKYSEAMQMGDQFPPITVFYDGSQHWLADGFHRVNAKKAIGGHKILAKVIFGTRRDAVLYSAGANNTHGLPSTKSDKDKFFCKILYEDKNNTAKSSSKTQNRKRNRKSNQHDEILSPSS